MPERSEHIPNFCWNNRLGAKHGCYSLLSYLSTISLGENHGFLGIFTHHVAWSSTILLWQIHVSRQYKAVTLIISHSSGTSSYGGLLNRGTPRSSIFMRFSIVNHPLLGTLNCGHLHLFTGSTSIVSSASISRLRRPDALQVSWLSERRGGSMGTQQP